MISHSIYSFNCYPVQPLKSSFLHKNSSFFIVTPLCHTSYHQKTCFDCSFNPRGATNILQINVKSQCGVLNFDYFNNFVLVHDKALVCTRLENSAKDQLKVDLKYINTFYRFKKISTISVKKQIISLISYIEVIDFRI